MTVFDEWGGVMTVRDGGRDDDSGCEGWGGGGVMTVAVRDVGGLMTVRDGGRGDDSSKGLKVGGRGQQL